MNTNLRIFPGTRRSRCPILACLLLVAALLLPALLGTGIPVLETRARAQPTTQVTLSRPDHIVIVIEENKGFSDIINSPKASYLNSLVTQGASLTSFYALHHPSQPNYMELFSGAKPGCMRLAQ